MPSFVFWNVKKRSRLDILSRLATEPTADFVMVAERSDDSLDIQECLNGIEGRTYRCVSEPQDRVKVFTSYKADEVRREITALYRRVAVYRVSLPSQGPFLLSAVHLKAKWLGMDDDDLYAGARRAREQIELIEAASGISRTLVVGDFNMAPFHQGMMAADGFHALMDRESVRRGERQIDFLPYNPMWSLLGTGPRDRRGPSTGFRAWSVLAGI